MPRRRKRWGEGDETDESSQQTSPSNGSPRPCKDSSHHATNSITGNRMTVLRATVSRLVPSKSKRDSALQYLVEAGSILNQLADATQNVPYVQMVSSVVVYVAKANDDIRKLRKERVELARQLVDLQDMLNNFSRQQQNRTTNSSEDVVSDQLRGALVRVTIVLEKCARAQSWTLYMKRSELLDDIIGSQRFLDTALRHFSVQLQLRQNYQLNALVHNIERMERKVSDSTMIILNHIDARYHEVDDQQEENAHQKQADTRSPLPTRTTPRSLTAPVFMMMIAVSTFLFD